MCDDEYKLAFVGIVNNLSRFIFMPIAGILSDRYPNPNYQKTVR